MPLYPGAVSELSPAKLIAMRDAMTRMNAQDELARGVPDERLYDAMIAAGYTPDEAGTALSARLMESLKQSTGG